MAHKFNEISHLYIDVEGLEGPGPQLDHSDVWLTYNINRPFVFLITTPRKVVFIGKYMG